jgi:predicted  nucleic acid-binding Zn-ribbon protein
VSASLVVEVLLGLLTAAVAVAALFSATRANRAQSQAAAAAVDAGAYERAREIYESAIGSLKNQTTDLHTEVVSLRDEVTRLRAQSADLRDEVTRLRSSNTDLKRQIAILNTPPEGAI